MVASMAAFHGKRVLITGGAGMLGSTLAGRLVAAGAVVTVLDGMLPQYGGNRFNLSGLLDRIRFIEGDIRNRALMRTCVAGADYIFNLAAQVSYIDSNLDVFTDLDVNAAGQLNLLEACRETGMRPRVVFASSRFIYGRIEYTPVDENHPRNCLSIYGIHKLAAEKYHWYYNVRHGLPTVSLRIANPYGPRQQMKHSRYGIVNWFIRLALDGEPLTVYGSGQQQRDYVYVGDVAEAFLMAALDDRAIGKSYNVGSGVGVRFREMAEMVAGMIPGTVVKEVPWEDGRYFIETGDYISDLKKIQQDIGWQPTVSLRDGIAKTIEFYRQHRAQYWSAPVASAV